MYIETERLIVRNFELRDKDDMAEYMLQRVNAWFEGYPWFSAEKADEEIKRRSESPAFFAIELKKEKKVIGNLYFGEREFNSKELGYVLNEKYQKKGYAREAAAAAMEYFFREGIHRIYAETAPENENSWRLMERLSMKKEAHFCKNVSFHSDENGNPIYFDTFVYASLNPFEKI